MIELPNPLEMCSIHSNTHCKNWKNVSLFQCFTLWFLNVLLLCCFFNANNFLKKLKNSFFSFGSYSVMRPICTLFILVYFYFHLQTHETFLWMISYSFLQTALKCTSKWKQEAAVQFDGAKRNNNIPTYNKQSFEQKHFFLSSFCNYITFLTPQ